MKAYENHCSENGQPDSHAKAKEILLVFIHRQWYSRIKLFFVVLASLGPSSTARLKLKE